MLLIISIILSIIVLIISTYFIYDRIIIKRKKSTETKHTPEEMSSDSNPMHSKKGKGKKKTTKNPIVESDTKTNTNEVPDNSEKNKNVIPRDELFSEHEVVGNVEVSEPILQVAVEPRCYASIPYTENTSIKIESKSDNPDEIKQFEKQNTKLNAELEEATKKVTFHKDEAESLKEENKNIKTKITKLERSKTKADEQLKKTEKTHSELLAKHVDLERKLAQNNAENLEMVNKFELVKRELSQNEIKLKAEQEKVKKLTEKNESSMKKIDDLLAKNKTENTSHVNTYKEYENKIEQLNADVKQLKIETADLSKILIQKEDENNQLSAQIRDMKANFNRILTDKYKSDENLTEATNQLKEKISYISAMDMERTKLLGNIENIKKEFAHKSEESDAKIMRLSEERDSINNDLQKKIVSLQKHIEQMNKEFVVTDEKSKQKMVEISTLLESKSSQFLNLEKANQSLLTDVNLLKNEISTKANEKKDDELEKKLLEISKELKEKNKDLTVLQDHKVELLNTIEQLKKEISSKPDSSKDMDNEISESIKDKENLIRDLMDEKIIVQKEFIDLKKEIAQRELKSKELEVENSSLLSNIKELRNSLKEFHSREIEILSDKNRINDNYLSVKMQLDNFEKEKENNYVNDTCQMKKVHQEFQTSNIPNNSATIEEMQSHIDKLKSEILSLQGRYYDLKNGSPVNTEIHVQNNVCQTEAVSIPPTLIRNDTAIKNTHSDSSLSPPCNHHLQDSIDKLNAEISQQRLKNQDLQKTFSDTSSEKNRLKTEYNQLLKNHDLVTAKYETLVNEFTALNNSSRMANSDTANLLENQIRKYQDENIQLKAQLEQYRETLEKTENCLQNIQASVDQEENSWKMCLKSSEQEQQRLEEKIKDLHNEIEELRSKKHSDSSAIISLEAPSIVHESLSSEKKKKKKRKNKKKKNKNRVTQP